MSTRLPRIAGPQIDPENSASMATDKTFLEFREDAEKAFLIARLA